MDVHTDIPISLAARSLWRLAAAPPLAAAPLVAPASPVNPAASLSIPRTTAATASRV